MTGKKGKDRDPLIYKLLLPNLLMLKNSRHNGGVMGVVQDR